jgi:hypothetical protein
VGGEHVAIVSMAMDILLLLLLLLLLVVLSLVRVLMVSRMWRFFWSCCPHRKAAVASFDLCRDGVAGDDVTCTGDDAITGGGGGGGGLAIVPIPTNGAVTDDVTAVHVPNDVMTKQHPEPDPAAHTHAHA